MKRKLIVAIIAGLFSGTMYAQSDFDFTQRWFNESMYNPAAVGNSFSTGFFLHSRAQWVGLDRAPVTVGGAFEHYSQELRSGFGLTMVGDYIGVKQNYHIRAAYAYIIDLGYAGMLSMGLSGGVFYRGWRINPVAHLDDPGDLTPPIYNDTKEYTPDFDFGIEYKGQFKFGLTLRHIGGKYLSTGNYPPDFHIWSYLSSRFNLNSSVSIEPLASFAWRANISRVEGGFLLYFLKTTNYASYNDRLWVGAVYRSDHNVALMAGVNITPQLRLGYSFDYGFGNVASLANLGTHEIFFAWQFNRKFYKDICCPAFQ
ncbi:MAG: PorP/SprF family type IX secretion system membrane protein [Bacteroidales bacterium]|nr:PorP/SprF family type IX secretion system membrane protein [Bacteroidales bacterium]MCL2132996.1 PorP/SprF family type IX secretion system membrane protein [Bacteroidales bacterium]